MEIKKKIELAREFAYSKFTAEERKLIEETDIDYCFDPKIISLINNWYRIYSKKVKELN